ncbi:hypothetical protein [Psychrobacter lutiphocae]|uniref:hypothetical protein n=1 Tax=Psychrobacter lutiphocae TaxID=540500 RepID=UPI00037A6CCD|nr:hypothetical protein [Psychrobacter lutiphocae]
MSLISKLIGKEITKICGEVFFESIEFIGENFKDIDILRFNIFFNDLNITFEVDSTGEGIVLSQDKPLKNVDMEEYGIIRIRDLTNFLNLKDFKSLKVTNIFYVMYKSITAGYAFVFDDEMFVILNWGDQLLCFNNLPDYISNDGYTLSNID